MPQTYVPRLLTLRDGSLVTIREGRADDAPYLIAMHERLSEKSKNLRYFSPYRRIDDPEAAQMCASDGKTKMVLVATPELNNQLMMAHACYIVCDPTQPNTAEAAILVEDQWQGRGLGSALLKHLASYAAGHGIQQFRATIHRQGEHILRFVERSGLPYQITPDQGMAELIIDLPSVAEIARIRLDDSDAQHAGSQ